VHLVDRARQDGRAIALGAFALSGPLEQAGLGMPCWNSATNPAYGAVT
jgi:hypothetical protein